MKAKAWSVIKEAARAKQDATAQRIARMIAQQRELEQKLQLLLDYRDEYRRRLACAQAEGIHGERLRNYQQFLANLQLAVEQQADINAAMQRQLATARASWAGDRRKVDSYEVLDQRQQRSADASDQRRQQAMHDEFAVINFLKRASEGSD